MHKVVRYACLALIVGLSVPAFFNALKVNETQATSSSSSLPTTINLNDNSENDVRNYYSFLDNKSTSERQGTNLLKNLREILHDDIVYYPYGSISSAGVTQIYTITDRDWVNSPASTIKGGTYDSSTGFITDYSHSKEKDNDPYIKMLYVDYDINGPTKFLNGSNANFDKEHVWSQSHGFKAESGATGPAGTDLHHLIAGEKTVNQQYHSNSSYGMVETATKEATSTTTGALSGLYINGNKVGTPVHNSSSDEEKIVFEPNDADKGRIARALLYMVACYNNYSGSETITHFDPNLKLVDYIIAGGTSVESSENNPAEYGILSDLLAWNKQYAPDEFEIHRNNLIYNNYQFNRNPFIDFPEWADYIWGTEESSYVPTGYATPDSDYCTTHQGGGSEPTVNSVTVSPSALNLDLNGTLTGNLTATVNVSNDAPQTVTWSSSDTSVATVSSSGVVTAVATGSATISAKSTFDTSKKGTCNVTVVDSSTPVGSNEYSLYSGTITEGDYIIYYNGKAMKNTVSSTRLDFTTVSPSNDKITNLDSSLIWHISKSGNYWKIYNAAVNKYAAGTGSKNQATLSSDGTEDGSLWTATGDSTYEFVNKGNSSSSVNANLRCNGDYGFACYSTSTGGALSLYKKSQSSKTLSSIALSNQITSYSIGDTFVKPTVTAHYSDGTTADVTNDTTFSGYNMSTAGNYTVTATYIENNVTKTATYNISVIITPTSVTLDHQSETLDIGDTLQLTATVLPANAQDKSITWLSDDEDVASVDSSGLVTAISEGTATIVASTVNDKTASCVINVNPSGEPTIISHSMAEIATANNWTTSSGSTVVCYTSFNLDENITVSTTGKANCGSFWGSDWRLYQNKDGNVIFTAASGYIIDSVTLTFSVTNTGTLIDSKSNVIESLSANTVGAQSVTYTVSNSSSATNGQVRISDISVSYHYAGVEPVTSISASVDKTYHPGESISSSDVTVKGNTGAIISTFTLVNDGYQFTYNDAPSGGSVATKQFTVKATPASEELTCTLTVNVSRNAYDSKDSYSLSSMNGDFSSLSTVSGNQSFTKDGITYSGIKIYRYSSYLSITSSSASGGGYETNGTIRNDTPFARPVKTVNCSLSDDRPKACLRIRYSENGSTWSTTNNGNAYYFEIYFEGTWTSGYVNISEISIELYEGATNLSNYIMFEDTVGQCNTKFDIAQGYFNNMPSYQKNLFMTSNDFVISSARTRLQDWAKALGKQIVSENGDYVIKTVKPNNFIISNENNNLLTLIIIVSTLGISIIGGYFYLKKKKHS